MFQPAALAKQSNPGRAVKDFFPKFPENPKLCPAVLYLYLKKTREIRGAVDQLFIAIIKPHLPVTSSTIARWMKVLEESGIDTKLFKAHSVRSASTSAAANQGVTTEDILKAADWSSDSLFQSFYYKPVQNAMFARTVLSSATNNTIDV